MIEAFEIGISVALADGVSEGIARAQKDADAVARAVAAGTVSVERLRQAGLAALTVVQPGVQPSKVSATQGLARSHPGTQPQEGAGAEGVGAAEPRQAGARRLIGAGEAVASLMAREHADAAPPSAVSMPPTGGAGPAGIDGSGPTANVQPATTDVAQAAFPSGHSTPAGFLRPVILTTLVPDGDKPGAPLPAARGDDAQRLGGGRSPTVPADACAGSGRSVALRLDDYGSRGGNFAAGGVRLAGSEGSQAVPATSRDGGAAGESAAYYAPVFAPAAHTSVFAPSHAGAPALQARDADTPASVASPSPAPSHGDVFLDGALVGRWMSRLLSREAGRAPAGPTGFDPRRNALLPGPTVGG
jgi:hypothetical protein